MRDTPRLYLIALSLVILLAPAFACTLTDAEVQEDTGADFSVEMPVLNAGDAAELIEIDFPVEILQPADNQTVAYTEGRAVEVYVSFEEAPQAVERVQLDAIDENGRRLDPPISRSLIYDATEGAVLLRWFADRPGIYTIRASVFLQPEANTPDEIPVSQSDLMTVFLLDSGMVAATQTWESAVATATSDAIATVTATALLGQSCRATIVIDNLHKRAGPGSNFRINGTFDLNESVEIMGRSPNNSWVYIRTAEDEEFWANNNEDWILFDPETPLCEDLPVIEADES